jgi:hypothetical protein
LNTLWLLVVEAAAVKLVAALVLVDIEQVVQQYLLVILFL